MVSDAKAGAANSSAAKTKAKDFIVLHPFKKRLCSVPDGACNNLPGLRHAKPVCFGRNINWPVINRLGKLISENPAVNIFPAHQTLP
ncbi:hypothetical protein TH468_01065 [Thalassospira sp. MCCC 1A03138]|nr:hypothetical protein TH468_01065 [Thalassospira sp. MCCC 1A03138]